MKRMIFVLGFALVSAMTLGAQSKTQPTTSTSSVAQSSATASKPAASSTTAKSKKKGDEETQIPQRQ